MKVKSGKTKKKRDDFLLLRLYVAGKSGPSLKAIKNLDAIAEEYFPGRHKMEIVNTLDGKTPPFQDGVLVTPALVIKRGPLPIRQIIGDLSDTAKVLQSFRGLNGEMMRETPKA